MFPSLTPGVNIPAGIYDGYADPISLNATVELRSRFFRFELFFPSAMELVVFGTASGTAPKVDLTGFSGPSYVVGAFLEQAGGVQYAFTYRLQTGVSYNLQTKELGFLFALR